MSTIQSLPIKEIYKIHNRFPIIEETGIKEYPVIKKYGDPNSESIVKSVEKIKSKRNIRLRTYLDEEEKKHRNIPGPGKYNIESNWNVPEHKIVNPHDRLTFLDEIIRQSKRNKSPCPGEHQELEIKYVKSFSRLNSKREKEKERIFYYDEGQYAASKLPGPGEYNASLPKNTSFRKNRETPEQNIKNFRIKSEKKLRNLQKQPDMTTYDPEDLNFFTFKTANKVKPLKKSFGIRERFKTEPIGSDLSPDKYDIVYEWKGKQSGKKTYEKQGLDMLSKPQSRVYN